MKRNKINPHKINEKKKTKQTGLKQVARILL